MEEFLKQNYLLITHSVEILAAVTGIFCLKKYKGTAVIYFIYFLIFIVFGELISMYPLKFREYGIFHWIENTLIRENYWWSTLYWKIGAIIFYVYYFRKILKTKRYKELIRWMLYGFIAVSIGIIALTWPEFFSRSFPVISILGAIIILTCSTFYFFEILQGDKILTFYKIINFYISGTILIWWLIITPLVFYDVYFSIEDWSFIFLKWQIYLFANVLMYLTFTFALIWCKPQNN